MIYLRPIIENDMEFLYRVYASTRHDELALSGWDEDMKDQFLRQQFHAQHVYYQDNYLNAEFSIILQDDEPIGRLYVHRRKDEIRLIDIALLKEYRQRGIGTPLIKDLCTEAKEKDLPVRIHVEHNNPAMKLYHRLGFKRISDNGVYYLMEWNGTDGKD